MMKEEFTKLIGDEVTDKDYAIIESVYTFHPAISNKDGKEQIARLYTEFGMSVIAAMLPVAEKMEELDREQRKLEARMCIIKERRERMAEGDFELEDTIKKVNALYMKANTAEQYKQFKSEELKDVRIRHIETAEKWLHI